MTVDSRVALDELRRVLDPCAYLEVFESLPQPVVVVDGAGRVVAHNPAARDLFGPIVDRAGLRCCELVRCGRGARQCLMTALGDGGGPMDGMGFVADGRRIEVIAVGLRAGAGAVLHFVTTGREAVWSESEPPLRITTLGPLRLERGGESLGGEWLDHRPGKLLKYLICARGRRVSVDELIDALWADSGRAGLTSVRQAVHGLRDRLEPDRPKHAASRFVLSRPNAYELDMRHIVVDADEFENHALGALRALERSGGVEAESELASAARLYHSAFLADEPYADWALAERNRLRDLAARLLRALAGTHVAAGRLPAAAGALERLAQMEPLDLDTQRDVIALMLRRRRHAEAARHYDLVRCQFRRAFGQDPDFALADLVEPAPRALAA
jgi:DNA-binding SARP family transcriptional activator